ncbi:uncharacterized protein ARMOST_20328 [Armillaria ostoyae]|uniref:Uncharacterized protein n=1 Tax=Armillaria ostoyae TaxID=47428 RepID=A0A284S724_ARMOS|nr:uncharacterized protein ARMOST_20328 [Armillaria ostoyae]
MATLSCVIADEWYSYSIALQNSTSSCSSLVHVPGDGEVEIHVNTDLFVYQCTLLLEVKEELPTDVVLGFDWFGSFAEQAYRLLAHLDTVVSFGGYVQECLPTFFEAVHTFHTRWRGG